MIQLALDVLMDNLLAVDRVHILMDLIFINASVEVLMENRWPLEYVDTFLFLSFQDVILDVY
jgi:hypothetical protein